MKKCSLLIVNCSLKHCFSEAFEGFVEFPGIAVTGRGHVAHRANFKNGHPVSDASCDARSPFHIFDIRIESLRAQKPQFFGSGAAVYRKAHHRLELLQVKRSLRWSRRTDGTRERIKRAVYFLIPQITDRFRIDTDNVKNFYTTTRIGSANTKNKNGRNCDILLLGIPQQVRQIRCKIEDSEAQNTGIAAESSILQRI